MKTTKLLLGLLCGCAAASTLAQTVPQQINYQGVFADATGTNLVDGNYTLSFRIYTDATAGTLVWGPQIFDGSAGVGHGLQVPLFGGRCNVVLGPFDTNGNNIVTALSGTNRFLEVSLGPVGSSTNIVPRQQILSAPYALKAGNADQLGGYGWDAVFGLTATNPATAVISGAKIQPASITTVQIANAAVGNAQLTTAAVTGDKLQVPLLIASNNAAWLVQVNNSGGPAISGVSTVTHGVFGQGPYAGVYGVSANTGGIGVRGEGQGIGIGVYAEGSPGIRAYGSGGYAAEFIGTITVSGAKNFKIDHPLDPANKYLLHSCVESPDMKNIYDGVATLDSDGTATVALPDWFEALNQDYRYQLTAIGAPAPNLYIAQEIADNRFKIAGGVKGMKVSWQVTGIRRDAWARAHRLVVEQEKPAAEKGLYLAPEEHGQPKQKAVDWKLRQAGR